MLCCLNILNVVIVIVYLGVFMPSYQKEKEKRMEVSECVAAIFTTLCMIYHIAELISLFSLLRKKDKKNRFKK